MSDWDAAARSLADIVGTDFRAALEEVADARDRPYYDAESDEASVAAYYSGVDLDRLGELVVSTHREQPRYKPSLELYPWVDLQPDGRLRSLYTGEEFEPEDLIEADFAVLQERVTALARAHLLEGDDPEEMEAQVEAQLPFNCEHVVPQSWFGKAEPMRGDLHHLFACESRCNGFRGNTPFAEFPDFPSPSQPAGEASDAVRDNCGKSAGDGFEPAHGKGAAARAAFYFRIRYPEHIAAAEMPPDRWDMLVAWHETEPVSLWERHRNVTISERQGNRNPFIDHPAWLTEVAARPTG
jgi:endonuclease I